MSLIQYARRSFAVGTASVLAFGTLFAAAPVHAQSVLSGTTVSPPSYEISVQGGEIVKKVIQVSNTSSNPQQYKMDVSNFVPLGEDGASVFYPAQKGSIADWVRFVPPSFTLQKDQTMNVTVEVQLPRDLKPGGHYFTVFASTQAGKVSGSGIGTSYAVGTNFLVTAAGNISESASVLEFSTPHGRVVPGETVSFMTRIKNTGNSHIKPQGMVEVFRGNEKVDELVVNAGGASVLPDSVRKFTVTTGKALAPGQYWARLSLRYGADRTLTVDPVNFVVIGETSMAAIVATILGIFVLILLAALMVNRKPVNNMNGRKM
jgi:uncharacterized membrane protein